MFGSFLYKDLPALRVKECYLCRYQTAVETMSFSLLEIIEVFSMFLTGSVLRRMENTWSSILLKTIF